MADVSDADHVRADADEISAALSEGVSVPAIDRLGSVARSMESLEWQFLRKRTSGEDLGS